MKKKLLSIIICVSMVLAGCSAGGSTAGAGATGDSASAGGTAEASAETASETEAAPSSEEGNGTGRTGKPVLEVIGEEEEDFDRAVQNRSSKKTADPNAYMLRNYSAKAEDSTVADVTTDEPDQNPDQDQSTEQPGSGPPSPKAYTVMVYIVGSNLESRMGAATNDIDEMRDAGLDYENTNLLLYTGGSRRWVSSIPNDVNSVLDMSKEEDQRIAAQTDVSANMGSPETLAEFVNYCTRNYPAEHYALILWDHGGGPLWGYGSDELFGNDSLLLDELRTAMDRTEFGQGKKLDWVGFDACLMGSLENAALWKDYAQYLIGSEELEAGRGWDYHFLSTLNETQDAEEIVRAIVDSFGSYYEENKSEFFNPDVTLSAMDLSKTEEVVGAVDTLFAAMEQGIGEGRYASLNQARSRTKAFGLGATESIEEAYDLLDLQDFATQLEEMYPEESAAVSKAVDEMVVHSTSNVEGTGGMSIYVPGNNKALFNASGELRADEKTLSSQYQSFVDSYTDEWFGESEIDWHLEELQEGDGELTLQLTGDQAKNVSQAYYAILWRSFSGEYQKALVDIPIEADENGVLHIPADPMLVTVASDTGESGVPWTCRQVSRKGDVNTYSTLKTFICAAHEMTLAGFDPDIDKAVDIVIRNKDGERETEVQDIVSGSVNAWNSGKGSIDVSQYTTVMDMGAYGRNPERDENGEMKPYSEWENGGSYSSDPVPVDSSFRFIMKPASEFSRDYVCQVVIRDVHDGVHASEIKDLNVNRTDENFVEVPTENGVVRYEVFEDHAEVYEYEGTDKEVEIAESISGKPVTVISAGTFGDNSYEGMEVETVHLPETIVEIGDHAMPYMKEVRLPDGLKVIGTEALQNYGAPEIEIPDSVEIIGASAFSLSDLESVKLPSSLKKIGAIPFHACSELQEISIDSSNQNYKTVDGVLYSSDGKTLIQYPAGKGGTYSIEEGTETIAYGAFQSDDSFTLFGSNPLLQVEFPESVKTIQNGAFNGRCYMESLSLPDSLEVIGTLAFGEESAEFGNHAEKVIDQVHIGPNVREIGMKAFTLLKIKEFDVDPGNPSFASVGGFITNKAGDTILIVPEGMGQNVVIPEGITTLPELIFVDMIDSTDFYIPDSVFRFDKSIFGDPAYSDLSRITIHCSQGSAAEAFANKYGIACDPSLEGEISAEDLSFLVEKKEEGGLEYTFHVYKDHAELAELQAAENAGGYIEKWEAPSEYNGLPVTVLGHFGEENASSVFTGITKLIVPDSVTKIYPEFLRSVSFPEEIAVAEGNPVYRCIDSVLFYEDHTLVYYPETKEDTEYTVPEGTVTIEEEAFHSETLQSLVVPDSVTTIENRAFRYCDSLVSAQIGTGVEIIPAGAFDGCSELVSVSLPEGLREIHAYAFDITDSKLHDIVLPSTVENIGSSAFRVTEGFGEIILPESLKNMDYYAFSVDNYEDRNAVFVQESLTIPAGLEFDPRMLHGVLLKRFEIAEGNPYHSVTEDGVLMSKDGRTLVAVPGQMEGSYEIPEGVERIAYGAFDEANSLSDIYLPDSLLDIGNLGEDPDLFDDVEGCSYKIHCHEGTEAQKQLDANGIEWVKIE